MGTLRVALLQVLACGDDQAANLAKGEAYCRKAREAGADVALFPEMWNIGYRLPPRASQGDPGVLASLSARAVAPDDPFVLRFQGLARELRMAIALTYLEKGDGRPGAHPPASPRPVPPRDSVSLIDRHGRLVMTYAKVHTCAFDAEAALVPGNRFLVGDLDTAAGPVRVGTMVCFDREFPESARILMLQGAEIILVPNACTLELNRLGQLRARAFENMVGVAVANYPAPQANGHSAAFSPVAFTPDESPVDNALVEADEGEGVWVATFDLDEIRRWRKREVWGNAFRHPEAYGPLTSPRVDPPFVRPDRR